MSHVKCSKCDRETPLECAHANRGFSAGFVCGGCYRSQVIIAVIVTVVIGGIALLFLANQSQARRSGHAASGPLLPASTASYTRDGVITEISEIIGFSPLGHEPAPFESTWREHLLVPITLGDLASTNFGYSDNLFQRDCAGSVMERNSKAVSLVVKCAGNYRFLVKQTRVEAKPNH